MMYDRVVERLDHMNAAVKAQESLRLQANHEMNDKAEKLSGELEGVQRKCVAVHDEITELAMVLKNSIENEKVRQEKTDDHIKTQINNVQRELTQLRCEHDNECSMLNRFLKNFEEQLSTDVKEPKFNQVAKVNKRSMAHEKLEQTHTELKGDLVGQDANHLEALAGFKNMVEQEIKAGEKDTSNTEGTFSVVSARSDTESITTESMDNLSDKLKKFCDELGRELQDSFRRIASVFWHKNLGCGNS